MKKSLGVLTIALALTALLSIGHAAGGDASNPLVSLKYLTGDFFAALEERIDTAIKTDDDRQLADAAGAWDSAVAAAEAATGSSYIATMTETRLKQGDLLSGFTGLQVLPLAGEVSVTFSSGAVIDVTDGKEISSGATLQTNHRYLVAEETTAVFTTDSKTAVIQYCGNYHFRLSDTPDYNAMARALKSLSLFRGTTTGFGESFDLENIPNRIESLIMLIRMLGEEEAALACTSAHPFADVPNWCAQYVAYAYEMGYTNGVGKDRYGQDIFGTYLESSAVIYTEFMLRALGFSSTATTDISDALVRARSANVLTDGECTHLQTTKFLRADVVYLSYYALESRNSSGSELYRALSDSGVFTATDYYAARSTVTTTRLR